MKSIGILAIMLFLVKGVPANSANGGDSPIVSFDQQGNLTWTLSFTNGLVAIQASTNLTGSWTPFRAMTVTNSSGGLPLPFTNRNQFYQVTTADSASNPPGMRLVPAGHFLMGDDNPFTYSNEKPRHSVYVSTFYVDQFEVPNEQIRELMQWAYSLGRVTVNNSKLTSSTGGEIRPLLQCKGLVDATAHNQVTFTNGTFGVEEGKTNHPCVGITWFGAVTVCNWRSERDGLQPCYNLTNWTCDFTKNGYRLPTEAEWEKAARGGQTGHNYPWNSPMANNNSYPNQIATNLATYTPIGLPHPFRTTPVGYYDGNQDPPGPDMGNGYGLYDVVGNVREWCWDWYRTNSYSDPDALAPDPTGPPNGDIVMWAGGSGPTRVTRGGSFDENQKNVRCSFRGQPFQSSPNFAHWYHGMRCVRRQR